MYRQKGNLKHKILNNSKLYELIDLVTSRLSMILEEISKQYHVVYGEDDFRDSTGFGLRKYKEWISAKYGTMAKHDFVKLHVLCCIKDMIVAFDVTDADSHDSPVFGRMLKDLPKGDWKPAILAAYDSYRKCEIILKAERIPVIKPRRLIQHNRNTTVSVYLVLYTNGIFYYYCTPRINWHTKV